MLRTVKPIHQSCQNRRHDQTDEDGPLEKIKLFAAIRRSALARQQVKPLGLFVAFEIKHPHPGPDFTRGAATVQAALAVKCFARYRFARMNLEDHLGDIIRKARAMNNVSTATAAGAAGIAENELATLEESGQFAKKINFAALAPVLGLNAAK